MSEISFRGFFKVRDERSARSAALGNNSTVRRLRTRGKPELRPVLEAGWPYSLASCMRQSRSGSSCVPVSPERFQVPGAVLPLFCDIKPLLRLGRKQLTCNGDRPSCFDLSAFVGTAGFAGLGNMQKIFPRESYFTVKAICPLFIEEDRKRAYKATHGQSQHGR